MKPFANKTTNAEFPDEQLRSVIAGATTKRLLKGNILVRKGDSSNKFYFVKSGCLRSYTLDEKGKEHIFMFAPEGWIVSDMDAFITDSPTMLFVDALEDSEVAVIDNTLFSGIPPNEQAIEKLTKRISVLQKRIILLMSATLQERYLDFLETYPDIAQRVPQKMIASYLGVTPEALSKIRGDISKNK